MITMNTTALTECESHAKKNKKRFSELPLEERKELYKTLERRGSLASAFPIICQPRRGLAFAPIRVKKRKKKKLVVVSGTSNSGKNGPDAVNHIKFLCRRRENIDARKLLYMLRTQLGADLDASQGLYLFVEDQNVLISGSQSMLAMYDKYKNEDGFLYLVFDIESTFG